MLRKTGLENLEIMIAQEYPLCHKDYASDMARKCIAEMDERLDEYLLDYACSGIMREFEHGEFSLLMIRSMCRCGYFRACMLMDGYIKDPVRGKAMILRR